MINLDKKKIFYDPYPHVLCSNAFDEEFYENLCLEFPEEMTFERFDFDKNNLLKQKKYVINEKSSSFKKIINKKKNLEKLYTYLSSQLFEDRILTLLEKNSIRLKNNNSYRNIIKKIINKIKNKKKFGFEFSMISTNGGFIKPHTDGADKLISFVIPIINNKNISEIINSGTNILKTSNDKYKYNLLNSTVPYEFTEVVREIPFDRNQIFFFIKTHNSLHSVGPMQNLKNENLMRKSINFFIYK